MAGVIYAIRTQMTRRGKMAFVTLDDGSGRQDIAVYSEMIDAHRDLLREDQLLVVEGKVSKDDYSGGFRIAVDKLMDLTAARTRFAKTMRLNCNGTSNAAELKDLLTPYRNGGCPVRIAYRNAGANCELELGEGWRVQLHDNLLKSLKERLREENVQVVY
jgi:DNA polymerase-3 subunit alpha